MIRASHFYYPPSLSYLAYLVPSLVLSQNTKIQSINGVESMIEEFSDLRIEIVYNLIVHVHPILMLILFAEQMPHRIMLSHLYFLEISHMFHPIFFLSLFGT